MNDYVINAENIREIQLSELVYNRNINPEDYPGGQVGDEALVEDIREPPIADDYDVAVVHNQDGDIIYSFTSRSTNEIFVVARALGTGL